MRSSAVVAVGTALSRLTGFVRIAAIAYALGVTALAGTYSYANETPNIVYELLLGGVLTATLVPLFVRHFESHDEDAASAVFTVSILVLLAVTVVGILLAPWIVDLYTLRVDGANLADQQALATDLLRLFMPQMLFYGIATLATAMLNAKRRFAAAAFAPVLNNIVVIAVFLTLPRDRRPARCRSTGCSTTTGAPAPHGARHDRGHRRDGAGPAPGAAPGARAPPLPPRLPASGRGHARARLRVDGRVRDREPDRAVLRHHPRQRDVRRPVRVRERVRVLPAPARPARGVALDDVRARARDRRRARRSHRASRRSSPAGCGSPRSSSRPPPRCISASRDRSSSRSSNAVRSPPTTRSQVADTLAAFAVGLLPFSLYLFALRAFTSRLDTRTPFLINCVENVVNIVLAFPLYAWLGIPGLALAFSLAYVVGVGVALVRVATRPPRDRRAAVGGHRREGGGRGGGGRPA